jgi:predicted TPR repeat methyltransferase
MDRQAIHQRAERFFDDLWGQEDAWAFDSSSFEQARFDALIAALGNRRYERVLEIGCGSGTFTGRLASLADSVVGLDISAIAIAKAERRLAAVPQVKFRMANIMEYGFTEDGPFDLIVMSETIYYLGWLYPFFDLAWLSARLYEALNKDGLLLLANTFGLAGDYLLLPWIIRTYHDLFRNAGYKIERESTFHGVKDETEIDVLITLFRRGSCESVHGVAGSNV